VRGAHRHGSTGRGVAEAKLGIHLVAGQIDDRFDDRVRELRTALLKAAAGLVGDAACDEARELVARGGDRDLFEAFVDAAHRPLAITEQPPAAAHVIFESAQGALLDRDHGFFPHVTPSRITRTAVEHAARELGCPAPLEVWGVLRAYHTRHGEGPFPSEDPGLAARLPELHNRDDGPAGRFRVGWFDAVLARHAIGFAGPIDRLAITCLDRTEALPERAIVDAWRAPDRIDTASASAAVPVLRQVDSLPTAIAQALGRPIDVASWGPTASAKRVE
jgi:adenylosuccinate synthase